MSLIAANLNKTLPFLLMDAHHLLRIQDKDCQLLNRHSNRVEVLLQLLRAFEQIQRQQLRMTNQLRQVLKQYYPVMLQLFSDVNTKIALAFLQTYPTPQLAHDLTRTDLEHFLRAHGYNHMRRLDVLHQTLRTPILLATVWQGAAAHAQALVPVVQTLNQQLGRIKRDIRQTFIDHPEAD